MQLHRDVRSIQDEIMQAGEPLQALCSRGLAEPGLAAQWRLSRVEQTEEAYVRWLIQNAVQQEALRQISSCMHIAESH